MMTIKDPMRYLPIDADRVYLTGYSMGGYGTFAFLHGEPRMFAAGIPIAGGCSVAIAQKLRKMPLWIFHGEKDDVVKPGDSRAIAKALEKMKAPVKYTEFPGEGHGIAGKVNSAPAVHTWLFEQKRKRLIPRLRNGGSRTERSEGSAGTGRRTGALSHVQSTARLPAGWLQSDPAGAADRV